MKSISKQKKTFTLTALTLILLPGCATYTNFGPTTDSSTKTARLFLMGHKGTPPISAMLKLKSIDSKDAWSGYYTGYDIKPGTYTLHYKLVMVAPGNRALEEIAYFIKHPYKVTAELKEGYAYTTKLRSETRPDNEICLYGEPIGAPGQSVRNLAFLSQKAELVACGSIDTSITYDSIW